MAETASRSDAFRMEKSVLVPEIWLEIVGDADALFAE